MATRNHLQVYRGENRTYRFVSTVERDVTGWTTLFTVKTAVGGATLFTKAGAIYDAATGQFSVVLTPTETLQTIGDYVHDFWRTDLGAETVLSEGLFEVLAELRV